MKRKFALGFIVATPNALETVNREDMQLALQRHARGEWGDCCPDDKAANEEALKDGTRLFSVYYDRQGNKFWIITEADRSSTTVLLPDDY